jgi:hypothetical protein
VIDHHWSPFHQTREQRQRRNLTAPRALLNGHPRTNERKEPCLLLRHAVEDNY